MLFRSNTTLNSGVVLEQIMHMDRLFARLDAGGENKRVPLCSTVWSDCGTVVQLGKTKRWYLQHTTHWTYDTIEDMYRNFEDSPEYKKYREDGGNKISLEKYRCARPYYCVPAGPNECACPMHTELEANRDAHRRRIRHVHKQRKCQGKCLESDFFVMTASSAAEKAVLLCPSREVQELEVNGVAPVLYKRACCEGTKCGECKWDEHTELRKKHPNMPPCFAAAMEEEMMWTQRVLEDSISTSDEGEVAQEDERVDDNHEGNSDGGCESVSGDASGAEDDSEFEMRLELDPGAMAAYFSDVHGEVPEQEDQEEIKENTNKKKNATRR